MQASASLDEANITLRGGITMDEDERPDQLLDGGNHRDDIDRWNVRRITSETRNPQRNAILPRDDMLEIVINSPHGRPSPRSA